MKSIDTRLTKLEQQHAPPTNGLYRIVFDADEPLSDGAIVIDIAPPAEPAPPVSSTAVHVAR